MQRAHEVLYYVGLGEARYRNLETYSTGMKQRIKLAQALDPFNLAWLEDMVPWQYTDQYVRLKNVAVPKKLGTQFKV